MWWFCVQTFPNLHAAFLSNKHFQIDLSKWVFLNNPWLRLRQGWLSQEKFRSFQAMQHFLPDGIGSRFAQLSPSTIQMSKLPELMPVFPLVRMGRLTK